MSYDYRFNGLSRNFNVLDIDQRAVFEERYKDFISYSSQFTQIWIKTVFDNTHGFYFEVITTFKKDVSRVIKRFLLENQIANKDENYYHDQILVVFKGEH